MLREYGERFPCRRYQRKLQVSKAVANRLQYMCDRDLIKLSVSFGRNKWIVFGAHIWLMKVFFPECIKEGSNYVRILKLRSYHANFLLHHGVVSTLLFKSNGIFFSSIKKLNLYFMNQLKKLYASIWSVLLCILRIWWNFVDAFRLSDCLK